MCITMPTRVSCWSAFWHHSAPSHCISFHTPSTSTPYAFILCPTRAKFLANPTSLQFIIPVTFDLHLVRSSMCNSVRPPRNFLPLNSKCALQHPVLGHPPSLFHLQRDRPCDQVCTYFHRSWKTINKQHWCSRMKISPLLLLLTLPPRCPCQRRLRQV